jgi:hypothetical protein
MSVRPISCRSGLAKAQVFARHRGLLRTNEAIRPGFQSRTLYALWDRGEIQQVSRGFYGLPEEPALTDPDLVTVALRIQRALICLISALAHHGLTGRGSEHGGCRTARPRPGSKARRHSAPRVLVLRAIFQHRVSTK